MLHIKTTIKITGRRKCSIHFEFKYPKLICTVAFSMQEVEIFLPFCGTCVAVSGGEREREARLTSQYEDAVFIDDQFT